MLLCNRCGKSDRVLHIGDYPTDFGGMVSIYLCQRCGVVAVLAQGER